VGATPSVLGLRPSPPPPTLVSLARGGNGNNPSGVTLVPPGARRATVSPPSERSERWGEYPEGGKGGQAQPGRGKVPQRRSRWGRGAMRGPSCWNGPSDLRPRRRRKRQASSVRRLGSSVDRSAAPRPRHEATVPPRTDDQQPRAQRAIPRRRASHLAQGPCQDRRATRSTSRPRGR